MAEKKNQKTENSESVVQISTAELRPFKEHPFKVRDDESMTETVESVKQYGILVPAIARPHTDGGYEIISGHRRKRACELAGLETMPVIVRDLDDDAAIIIMVDSNLQRESLLPSERAQAYKMKLEAMNRRGQRVDLTCSPAENKLKGKKSAAIIGESSGDSKDTVYRYIRLTELVPELQQMVDDNKIAFRPAVELSYLKPKEQVQLLTAIESEQATPSLSQAQRLKKASQAGLLSEKSIISIMAEEKKPEVDKLVLPADTLRKYFPKKYTPQKMQETIIKLLDQWQKKREQQHER